jgi:spore coat polysaccharide biosynthesis protein SpsF
MAVDMKTLAIVQARMGSTRLPGKVLLPLSGIPVIEHIVTRLRCCHTFKTIVVATSIDPSDDAIEQWCKQKRVAYYRGSLMDVLDRYYQAATAHQADAVVRITGDCPVIDPAIVDEVVLGFIAGGYDAFSLAGEFPDGLDCQVFSYSAIAKAWREATLPSEREHVGPYIEKNHPELFNVGGLNKFEGQGHHRWTLDEPRDYLFLQAVFDRLYREDYPFTSEEVLNLLENEPNLMQLNSSIIRNEGYLKSIRNETN